MNISLIVLEKEKPAVHQSQCFPGQGRLSGLFFREMVRLQINSEIMRWFDGLVRFAIERLWYKTIFRAVNGMRKVELIP